jgi:uncharacterized small protein (DUF1192 family)
MYGYGLEGYGMYGEGYRYPRRRRKLSAETYYPEEVHPQLVRATVFNRAVARENPWIRHLRDKGFYDEVRKLLAKYKKDYKPKDPEKRAKSLQREITKLQAQLNVLEGEAKAKTLAPIFSRKYPRLKYEDVMAEKIKQLQDEITRLKASMPTDEIVLRPG